MDLFVPAVGHLRPLANGSYLARRCCFQGILRDREHWRGISAAST
jgi:hypothetical protein